VRCDSSLAYLAIHISYVDAVPLVIARHKDHRQPSEVKVLILSK
jgi:hypothetical protein